MMTSHTNNKSKEKLDEYLYRPYIKTVCILLPDYTYRHTTDINDQSNFVGRDDAKSKLKGYLFNKSNKGSYLITGYRGMGKTSLVNGVLNPKELKENGYERINISFGQKNITEIDVLRQCVFEIKNKIDNRRSSNLLSAMTSPLWAIGIGTLMFSLFYGILLFKDITIKITYLLLIFALIFLAYRICENILCATFKKGLKNKLCLITLSCITIVSFYFLGIWPVQDLNKSSVYDYFKSSFNKLINVIPQNVSSKRELIEIDTTLGLIVLCAIISAFISILLRIIAEQFLFYRFKSVLDRIQFLYDRCSSIFTTEESSGTGADQFPIVLSKRKQKSYPIAGSKEISNELINLLDHIDRKIGVRFIFVFDELDKIDSTLYNVPIYEDTEMLDMKGETVSYNEHRKRKKLVLDILSSLKYLITEANAKFVFIAGSEMFDAALADVSDRNSAISSIFGHIINVDSFYKDKEKKASTNVGITSLIESYLAKIIDPNEHNKGKSAILNFDWNVRGDLLNEEDRLKVIYTIQHFITYLAYRSTGAPKKMIRLIEEHISFNRDLEDAHKIIHCASHSKYKIEKNKLYLIFSYHEQYKMGLLNYFYRPIILGKSRTMKNYSNSLLVVIPYLMDHIIKFHGSAFSMENLELLPEVLAPNRNPELRLFLEELIENFKQNLLRETDTKFFDYKFNTKIVNEIIHASTLFAEESAAFNFTLDENYNIKVYLRLKIKELRNIYQHFGGSDKNNILDSIALFNSMLGDVSYYDREYSDSIGAYLDALNALKTKDEALIIRPWETVEATDNFDLKNFHFASYIRILMKLGLAYEKIKAYHNALGCYQDVINLVLQNKLLKKNTIVDSELSRMISNAFFATLFLLEKKPNLGYYADFFGDKFKDVVKHIYEKNPSGFLTNLSLLFYYRNEDIKAVIRSTGEKNPLFGIMKDISGGLINWRMKNKITNRDILELALSKLTNQESIQKTLDYLRDGYFQKTLRKSEAFQSARMLSRYGNYLYTKFPYEIEECRDENDLNRKSPISRKALEEKNKSQITKIIQSINEITTSDEGIASNLIKNWLQKQDIKDLVSSADCELLRIIFVYTLSAKLYLYADHSLMGGHQYRKILAILRNLAPHVKSLSNAEDINIPIFLVTIQKMFVKRALQIASWNSSSTDRTQVYKYKHALNIDTIFQQKYYSKYNYHSTSNASDIKETLWHFVALREICIPTVCSIDTVIENNPNQSFVSQAAVLHTMVARMNELSVQCAINQSLLENYKNGLADFSNHLKTLERVKDGTIYDFLRQHKQGEKIQSDDKDEDLIRIIKELAALPYLVANQMFCLNNILLIMQTQGNSFLISYTNIADIYRRLGDWLKHYELCRVLYKEFKDHFPYDVEGLTKTMIGETAIRSMDTTSMYQLATRNYRLALASHDRGGSYRYLISNMFYLEDDFHDNLTHFAMAFERQKIYTEEQLHHSRELNKELNKSSLFDYDYHVNNEVFPKPDLLEP
jgi:hypothetical protein